MEEVQKASTLFGVLREIEGMINCPIPEKFDLIFGTSTGAIIAAFKGWTIRSILYSKDPRGMTAAFGATIF